LNLKSLILNHKFLFIGSALFLLGATISIFASTNLRAAAGEWKAFYVEPFLVFLILVTTLKTNNFNQKNEKDLKIRRLEDYKEKFFNLSIFQSSIMDLILYALILCGLITSVLAIYQYSTGWMVPYAFWQNRNTFRVTAWYGFPNGVGLFLAPLVPLAIYLLKQSFLKFKKTNWKFDIWNWKMFIDSLLLIPCALLAIYYAKSTGGLIGVAAGIGLLLLFYKKTRWPAVIICLVGFVSIVSLPSLSSIRNEIFAQDRSGQIRVGIWKETFSLLKDRPLLGAGMASYNTRIIPYHKQVNGENIEIFHHPHNVFLTIWVNTGIIGLIGFLGILFSGYRLQVTSYKKNKTLPLLNYFLIASLTTILVTGLVDSPYIKNDLSVFFWTIIALLIISYENQRVEDTSA
jgi:O-antigen ligase